VRRLDELLQRIITQRRSEAGDRGDLLTLLMRARDEVDNTGMTDRQLRDEVMTMYLAGHDTTANALSWTWWLLATHPQVEETLLAELQDVVGDRLPTAADVPRLVYAEQVVQESLRLYPPAYVIGREPLADCTIGRFHVPKGCSVLMPQWVVHHDPRFFPEPEAFLPERWSEEFRKSLPKYAYFPFGGGPRVCIGNTFAMQEAILVLATMLPRVRFELSAAADVSPWPSVTLRPRHGIRVTVRARQTALAN
jgi:cytochrome P450